MLYNNSFQNSLNTVLAKIHEHKEPYVYARIENNQLLTLCSIKPESREYFQKHFEKSMKCSICEGIIFDPVACNDCKEVFCKQCIQSKIYKNEKCPLEDCFPITVSVIIDEVFKKKFEKVKINCFYNCNSEINLLNYALHLQECEVEYKEIYCKFCRTGKIKEKIINEVDLCLNLMEKDFINLVIQVSDNKNEIKEKTLEIERLKRDFDEKESSILNFDQNLSKLTSHLQFLEVKLQDDKERKNYIQKSTEETEDKIKILEKELKLLSQNTNNTISQHILENQESLAQRLNEELKNLQSTLELEINYKQFVQKNLEEERKLNIVK